MEWNYKKYNGWSNYFTWNAALYIDNEYHLYQAACVYARDYQGDKDKIYESFIEFMGLKNHRTGDGVLYLGPNTNIKEMNAYMLDLVS